MSGLDDSAYAEAFLEFEKGAGYSKGTIVRNGYFLKRFLAWLKPKTVKDAVKKDIWNYAEYLKGIKSPRHGRPLKPCSVYLELGTVKSFFGYLENMDLILKNPVETLAGLADNKKGLRPIFSQEEINRLLDGIGIEDPYEERDRAIFELIYSSGLRIREALNLEVQDLNLEERVLLVREGKGRKDRYVPFSRTALRFVVRYMHDARKGHEKRLKGEEKKKYLFLDGRNGRMSYERLRMRFACYLERCGLSGRGYTIHSIRHATGTHLLANGAGIRYVQELLGHEDLKTTQLYTRPQVENIKAVYRTYHPRENEYFRELDEKYLRELKALKDRLAWGRKASEQYRLMGHKKGYGNYREKKGGIAENKETC